MYKRERFRFLDFIFEFDHFQPVDFAQGLLKFADNFRSECVVTSFYADYNKEQTYEPL